jgi:putative nucleotidyltransferase with HDIG domain
LLTIHRGKSKLLLLKKFDAIDYTTRIPKMTEYSKNKKILVVEDEQMIRDALAEIVSSLFDFEVDVAADGSIALEMIRKDTEKYGIVLTDLKMPNLDGVELINQAKEINQDIVFVVITGFATRDNAVSALKRGAYDFVQKPFELDELTAVLKRAVEHHLLIEVKRNYQKDLENLVRKRTAQLQSLNDDLRNLLALDQKVNKMMLFDERIKEYQSNILSRFKPDTAIFILYDNLNDSFKKPWIFTKDAVNVHLPEDDTLLSNQKFYCGNNDNQGGVDEKLRLNRNDMSFFLSRLEHEVFLGYFYLGFEKDISPEFENALKVYTTSLETMLYSDYLVTFHQREMETMFLSGIKTISDTVEASSPFTRKHSDRVVKGAEMLANKLGFSYERKYILKIACILHDIGKVGIENRILNKAGELTEEEMEILRQHPVVGANIVQGLYGFKIDYIIRSHHERWDGAGYPDGFKGEEIPLESRIIAIADAFDAMGFTRPYREGGPLSRVISELKENAGTQFDPELVDIFVEFLGDHPTILQDIELDEKIG